MTINIRACISIKSRIFLATLTCANLVYVHCRSSLAVRAVPFASGINIRGRGRTEERAGRQQGRGPSSTVSCRCPGAPDGPLPLPGPSPAPQLHPACSTSPLQHPDRQSITLRLMQHVNEMHCVRQVALDMLPTRHQRTMSIPEHRNTECHSVIKAQR